MKQNLSDDEHARRAAHTRQTIAKPEAAQKRWLATLARSLPSEKRQAIFAGLMAGKSPDAVYRIVKRDFGEVHIATVQRIAKLMRARKIIPRTGVKPLDVA